MTRSCSKYTVKVGYSQRLIGGSPTAGTRFDGAPYWASTLSMVRPLPGTFAVLCDGVGVFSSSAAAVPVRARAARELSFQGVVRMGNPPKNLCISRERSVPGNRADCNALIT